MVWVNFDCVVLVWVFQVFEGVFFVGVQLFIFFYLFWVFEFNDVGFFNFVVLCFDVVVEFNFNVFWFEIIEVNFYFKFVVFGFGVFYFYFVL